MEEYMLSTVYGKATYAFIKQEDTNWASEKGFKV